MFKKLAFSLIAITFLASAKAYACGKVDGIPDYNCDGQVRMVFLGDSLAYGFGDTKNGNKGGYILRVQKKFPNVKFLNFGEQGLMTQQLLLKVNRALKEPESTLSIELHRADYVFLDLGRNDRWLFGLPSQAYRNLKKTSALIATRFHNQYEVSPLTITAVMMLPNRGSQGPWVKELDALILKSNSKKYPADLRFDLVSKRLLSTDQIHPTAKGYDSLAITLTKYLKKELLTHVKALMPDTDEDKLPDFFETTVFGTDPNNPDTDGNGILDGDEFPPKNP